MSHEPYVYSYSSECHQCDAEVIVHVEGSYYPATLIDPPEYPTPFIVTRACDENCTVTNESIEDRALEAYNEPYEPSYDTPGYNLPY